MYIYIHTYMHIYTHRYRYRQIDRYRYMDMDTYTSIYRVIPNPNSEPFRTRAHRLRIQLAHAVQIQICIDLDIDIDIYVCVCVCKETYTSLHRAFLFMAGLAPPDAELSALTLGVLPKAGQLQAVTLLHQRDPVKGAPVPSRDPGTCTHTHTYIYIHIYMCVIYDIAFLTRAPRCLCE